MKIFVNNFFWFILRETIKTISYIKLIWKSLLIFKIEWKFLFLFWYSNFVHFKLKCMCCTMGSLFSSDSICSLLNSFKKKREPYQLRENFKMNFRKLSLFRRNNALIKREFFCFEGMPFHNENHSEKRKFQKSGNQNYSSKKELY